MAASHRQQAQAEWLTSRWCAGYIVAARARARVPERGAALHAAGSHARSGVTPAAVPQPRLHARAPACVDAALQGPAAGRCDWHRLVCSCTAAGCAKARRYNCCLEHPLKLHVHQPHLQGCMRAVNTLGPGVDRMTTVSPLCYESLLTPQYCAQGGTRAVDSLGAGVRGMSVAESQAAAQQAMQQQQQQQQQPYAAPQQHAAPMPGMPPVPQQQQGLLRSNSYH